MSNPLCPGKCMQYGHSCLGGHGKRNGQDLAIESAPQINSQQKPISNRVAGLLRQIINQRLAIKSNQANLPYISNTEDNSGLNDEASIEK